MEELLLSDIKVAIIPTVLIPLSIVSVVVSMIASFIAGLFGIELSTEGPRKFLELLLKPKFIVMAIFMNLFFYGLFQGYGWLKNYPSFITTINLKNDGFETKATYSDQVTTEFSFNRSRINKKAIVLKEEKVGEVPSGAFYTPLVTDKTLLFGSKDGIVYEITKQKLKLKRKFFAGTFIPNGMTIKDNHLFFGEGVHATHHARIYKVSMKDFKLVDSFSSKGHTEGTSALVDNDLIFGAGDDGVYKISTKDMSMQWHAPLGHVDAEPLVYEDTVYFGTGLDSANKGKTPKAFAVDLKTGMKIWERDLIASSWFRPIAVGSRVCFVAGEIYFKTEVGGLECFDKDSGKHIKTFRTQGPMTSLPITLGDQIVFSKRNGEVCSLNSSDLEKSWCQQTADDGASYSSIMYDRFRDVLLLATKKSGLFVLDPDNGKVLTRFQPDDWSTTFARPAVAKEGVYLVDLKGKIRFLNYN